MNVYASFIYYKLVSCFSVDKFICCRRLTANKNKYESLYAHNEIRTNTMKQINRVESLGAPDDFLP